MGELGRAEERRGEIETGDVREERMEGKEKKMEGCAVLSL